MPTSYESIPFQPIPYTLTMVSGGKRVRTVALPNNPNKVMWAEDFPTSVEYTLGDIPKREHNKPKRWTVQISGRTGVAVRAMENGEEWQPMDIMVDFIEFLELYQTRCANVGATGLRSTGSKKQIYAGTYLILDAFKEDIHLAVDVVSFSFDRDANTTRHSAAWSLNLIGWQKIGMGGTDPDRYKDVPNYADVQYASPEEGAQAQGWMSEDPGAVNLARLERQGNWNRMDNNALLAVNQQSAESLLRMRSQQASSFLKGTGAACNAFDLALRSINQGVSSANAAITKWSNAITKIQTHGLAFQRSMVDFRNMLRSGIDIVHMPQRILSDLANTSAVLRETFYDIYYAQQYIDSGMGLNAAWNMLLLATSAHEDTAVMIGSSGGKIQISPALDAWGTKAVPLSAVDEGAFGTVYSIPAGVASWSDISTQVYGDPGFWVLLAKFNGAYDGFSDSDGKPLQQGTLIYLPAAAGKLMTGKKPQSSDFYLTDFLLDETGDISMTNGAYLTGNGQVTDSTGTGDLQTVSGFANLIQAITTLTRTPYGSLSDYPNYGLLAVEPGDSINAHKAAMVITQAQDQLRADFRIATVQNPAAILDVDALALKFDLVPAGVNPEPITVVAPVPTL